MAGTFLDESTPSATVQQPATRHRNAQRPEIQQARGNECNSQDCKIVIGVDEAGYGPNIGPLLIAASAWRIPKDMDEAGFVSALANSFRTEAWSENCEHVPLGDSKQLYSSSTGLRTLEAGLLTMLKLLPSCADPSCLAALLEQIDDNHQLWQHAQADQRLPWYGTLDSSLPLHNDPVEIARLSDLARAELARERIELLAVRSSVVFESRFNDLVGRLGSKGRLLSHLTMELVCSLLGEHESVPIEVYCDRQGGRKKYACVLLEAMPDEWFDTLCERNERSSYRRQRQPELTFHFSVGGDSFPPTALASMTAKYLRERLMASINRYWQTHVSELAPTAGYPQDAKRFRAQIESVATKLNHSLDQWWRSC